MNATTDPADFTAALKDAIPWAWISGVADLNAAQNIGVYIYPLFFILLILLVVLATRHKLWTRFAEDHKWLARIALFFMMIFILMDVRGVNGVFLTQVRGKISPEFPSLTGTAIKIGVYNLEFTQQAGALVPQTDKDLYNCVLALGTAEAKAFLDQCNSLDCVKPIPASTREQILEEIKSVQSGKIPANEQMQVCYRVSLR